MWPTDIYRPHPDSSTVRQSVIEWVLPGAFATPQKPIIRQFEAINRHFIALSGGQDESSGFVALLRARTFQLGCSIPEAILLPNRIRDPFSNLLAQLIGNKGTWSRGSILHGTSSLKVKSDEWIIGNPPTTEEIPLNRIPPYKILWKRPITSDRFIILEWLMGHWNHSSHRKMLVLATGSLGLWPQFRRHHDFDALHERQRPYTWN